jgi:hypothetical protein
VNSFSQSSLQRSGETALSMWKNHTVVLAVQCIDRRSSRIVIRLRSYADSSDSTGTPLHWKQSAVNWPSAFWFLPALTCEYSCYINSRSFPKLCDYNCVIWCNSKLLQASRTVNLLLTYSVALSERGMSNKGQVLEEWLLCILRYLLTKEVGKYVIFWLLCQSLYYFQKVTRYISVLVFSIQTLMGNTHTVPYVLTYVSTLFLLLSPLLPFSYCFNTKVRRKEN